jgi:Fe-S-cluster containining protein
MSFVILNREQARFECTFGRGCEGICCRNGRPPVYPDDAARIDANLDRVLPGLRPEARAMVEKEGYVSRRRKEGQPAMRVAAGWCVFFNEGCVLHRLGAEVQDPLRYKPWACAVFPISRDRGGPWYVRQKGLFGEKWDLGCLDPAASTVSAGESLQAEIAMVEGCRRDQEKQESCKRDQENQKPAR